MDIMTTARELESMAQTGLHFTQDEYDRDRYNRLREIAAEMIAANSNLSAEQIVKWNESEFGYATPKVDVRAFILQDDKILLISENQDGGRWTLPGGWADVNDTPTEAVIREVSEESGYEVVVDRLLAVYDRERQGHMPPHPFHVYKIFFQCTLIGGEPRPNRESSQCGFFTIDALPELSTSRVLPKQIKKFYEMCTGTIVPVADYD